MNFELVEPVGILFKDEVRVPGAITRDRLKAVRESDAILREEIAKNGLDEKI